MWIGVKSDQEASMPARGRLGAGSAALALALWVAAAVPARVEANCNLIPQLTTLYGSTLGSIDRALAAPGEAVSVRVDLACNPFGLGFSRQAGALQVALQFRPPGPGGTQGPTTDVPVTAQVETRNCADGANGRCDTVRFVVPDTDALVAPDGDGRGLTGPAAIRVTDVASNRVLVDVGPLYQPTRSCDDRKLEAVFQHFTVLPRPTPFQDLVAGARDLLATLDGGGNLLIPLDFAGVLIDEPVVPVFRVLSAGGEVPAFGAAGPPFLLVPDGRFVRSFNHEGRPIPPILGALAGGQSVFGSADARLSVLRIARFDPDATPPQPPGGIYDFSGRLLDGRGPIVIQGVQAATQPLARLADLASADGVLVATIDEALNAAIANGDGDIVDRVPAVTFEGQALSLGAPDTGTGFAATELSPGSISRVPFSVSLSVSAPVVAMSASERRDSPQLGPLVDRNADGDAFDALLRVVSIDPAVPSLSELTAGQSIAMDPSLAVNGRSFAAEDGQLVWFRARESDAAPRLTESPSTRTGDETRPALFKSGGSNRVASLDARWVAFSSRYGKFVKDDDNHVSDVFVVDRHTDQIQLISRPVGYAPPSNGASSEPSLSRDGRWLGFVSEATNLVSGFAPGAAQIYVADLESGVIVPITATPGGAPGNGAAANPNLSADGRFVVFDSAASNLVGGDGNGVRDVFVRDRDSDADGDFDEPGDGVTRLVSLSSADAPGSAASRQPDISADGRFVAFVSASSEFVAGLPPIAEQVFVRDRDVDADGSFDVPGAVSTERVSGGDADAALAPSISGDGRFVAFDSAARLVSADGDAFRDVYVRDRDSGAFDRVSRGAHGEPPDGDSFGAALDDEGRFVAFSTHARSLVPIAVAASALPQVVLHDRLTDVNEYSSVGATGIPTAAGASEARISGDGRTVLFTSVGADLFAADCDDQGDVFTRSFVDGDGGSDWNLDGDRRDTVVRIFDAASAVAGPGIAAAKLVTQGPLALALVPEVEQGGLDRNGDDDVDDQAVFLLTATGGGTFAAQYLDLVGSDIAFSNGGANACVSVPERDEGNRDRNGDLDVLDDVLAGTDGGVLANRGIAVDTVGALGALCLAIAPEVGQQGAPIAIGNGDGDAQDRVLVLVDAGGPIALPGGDPPAEEFAHETDGRLIAFRTCEEDDGETILNEDGDVADCVMQVLELPVQPGATPELINTRYAAFPCLFESCAFFYEPYRVRGDTVSFPMREADQSGPITGRAPSGATGGVGCLPSSPFGACDVTGDGDALDTVIVVFNVRSRQAQIFEVLEDDGFPTLVPFPTTVADRTVLPFATREQRVLLDCNGDGDFDDSCVLLVGDSDEDGVLDESLSSGDNAREFSNPDQSDGDEDGLGDVIDPNLETVLPEVCDLDRDDDIDRLDIERIFSDRGMQVEPGDPRDPNRDGRVTVLDSGSCTELCDRPNCAPGPGCGLGVEALLPLALLLRGLRRRSPARRLP